MKNLLFTVIIFMLMTGFVSAKEPEYEVTIHVVYNSIPVSEIENLVGEQLRKHKDACAVKIEIKKPENTTNVTVDSNILMWNDSTRTLEWNNSGDIASD